MTIRQRDAREPLEGIRDAPEFDTARLRPRGFGAGADDAGGGADRAGGGVAREQALRLLARREHSRLELRRKLASRGYADAVAESVVARLAADGLQSDERFAQGRVRSAVAKGQGPLKIRADLRDRGVNAEVLAMALDAVTEWSAIARRALAKRFGEAMATDGAERARRARFLEARGFSDEVIRETLGG